MYSDRVPEDNCLSIRAVKTAKTFHADKIRLHLAIEACEIRRETLSALTQLGGVRKFGRPPMSAMESELQRWLEVFTGDGDED